MYQFWTIILLVAGFSDDDFANGLGYYLARFFPYL